MDWLNIQAKPGPARVGRKKRLKDLFAQSGRNTLPIVADMQFEMRCIGADQFNHNTTPTTMTVSQGISDDVPKHLMEVRAIEAQRRTVRAGAVDDHRVYTFLTAELFKK